MYSTAFLKTAMRLQKSILVNSSKSNEERREKSYNSRFAKHMRKEKAALEAKDGKAIWEFEYQRNIIKLSFLILIYLYTQDDDEISSQEKRSINKILDQKGAFLKSYDYDEITKHIDNLPDLRYVLNYIEENDIKENIFNESVSTVKELIENDSRYVGILDDLERRNR